MSVNEKAIEALKATQTLIDYLNDEESFCNSTTWIDSKGYILYTDTGYFFDGLLGLANLLAKRCSDAIS